MKSDWYLWSMAFVLLAAALVVGLLACVSFFVTSAPEPVVTAVLWVSSIIFCITIGLTAIVGVAITATLPPLRPVAEKSILGKRTVALAKYMLATATVFGTVLLGWMMGATFERTLTDPELFRASLDQMVQLLWTLLLSGAFAYWIWLSVDLLRLKKRRRRNAIDFLVRRREPLLGRHSRAIRVSARFLLGSPVWIVLAFYMAPLLGFYVFQSVATPAG